jgi:hypothetical protein
MVIIENIEILMLDKPLWELRRFRDLERLVLALVLA